MELELPAECLASAAEWLGPRKPAGRFELQLEAFAVGLALAYSRLELAAVDIDTSRLAAAAADRFAAQHRQRPSRCSRPSCQLFADEASVQQCFAMAYTLDMMAASIGRLGRLK